MYTVYIWFWPTLYKTYIGSILGQQSALPKLLIDTSYDTRILYKTHILQY